VTGVARLEPAGARADAIAQSLGRISELDPFDLRETEIGDLQIQELADARSFKAEPHSSRGCGPMWQS
jgi:hypothetical protein